MRILKPRQLLVGHILGRDVATLAQSMRSGQVSEQWKNLNPANPPPPMPPILSHTLLTGDAFASQAQCYKHYRETLAVLARMNYERQQLIARMWQFYEETAQAPA
jgi:hypothetical protein